MKKIEFKIWFLITLFSVLLIGIGFGTLQNLSQNTSFILLWIAIILIIFNNVFFYKKVKAIVDNLE